MTDRVITLQRKIDEAKIAELRNAISQDKKDIVADSEKKSDMIRQLKDTLTDAKSNLERARYKQREIINNNQQLRADNQALQKVNNHMIPIKLIT